MLERLVSRMEVNPFKFMFIFILENQNSPDGLRPHEPVLYAFIGRHS